MWIYKSWKFTDEPAGGPTYCAHMLNQCDDTPPGPFPLLGCLLLLNLRGWCCSTNETASIKTQQDKVGRGKESGRELCKTSDPQWFWQEVHFKETWWVQGVFQEPDTRLMPRLSILRKHEKILLPYRCIPWTSPHPQRWHLMLWVVAVAGCHWEEQDPVQQFLQDQKGTYYPFIIPASDILYPFYIFTPYLCLCTVAASTLTQSKKECEKDNVNLTSIWHFPPPKKKTKLKVSRHDPWPGVHR